MAAWTAPVILATGSPLPSTAYNGVANNTTFLWERPVASYYDSVGTPIPSDAYTVVQLNGTTFSNYGWEIVDGNTLICPLSGLYAFNFRIGFGFADAGGGLCWLFHNGLSIIAGSWVSLFTSGQVALGYTSQSVGCGLLPCSAGDQITLVASQNSGGDINCVPGSANTCMESFLLGSL